MTEKLEIRYKLFFEAEDVSQSRIMESTSYITGLLKEHQNSYIKRADLDDESDLEEFALRLYVNEQIAEADCENVEAAENFVDDMAELVSEIAAAHSYLDMEGSFSISLGEDALSYRFSSAAGDDGCDFVEGETTE